MLKDIIALDNKYFMNTFGSRIPVCFTHGKGMKLYSDDGREYTDFFAGIAVNALGHAHPDFVAALRHQLGKLIHTSNLYYIEAQARLAQLLCENSCADKVFFSNSGAEANEAALKLAKIYFYKKGQSQKNEIITLTDSFHGRTLTTVAATGQPKYQKPYHPLTPGFTHVDINDLSSLKSAITPHTAAIMLELIQGESGVHPCDPAYVKAVRSLCDENEILLIIDEVQTGIGRTGKMFAYENYEIEPDIFTLAKALGGGLPIGAVCAKEKFAAFEPGDHGSTFGGNPLCCTAGLAVLDIVSREHLVENAQKLGNYFTQQLLALGETYPAVTEVRGMGLMIGLQLRPGLASQLNSRLFEKGILAGCCGDTLRLLPPLIVSRDDIDQFISITGSILEKLE